MSDNKEIKNTEENETPIIEDVSVASTQSTNTPTFKELKINLSNPTKIIFVVTSTGEQGSRLVHEERFALTKTSLIKVPLTDPTIDLKYFNIIKLDPSIAMNLRILTIENGIAIIEPIVHGFTITNDMLLGIIY